MFREILLFPAGTFLGMVSGAAIGALFGLEHTGFGAIIGVAVGSALGGLAYAFHAEGWFSSDKNGDTA